MKPEAVDVIMRLYETPRHSPDEMHATWAVRPRGALMDSCPQNSM